MNMLLWVQKNLFICMMLISFNSIRASEGSLDSVFNSSTELFSTFDRDELQFFLSPEEYLRMLKNTYSKECLSRDQEIIAVKNKKRSLFYDNVDLYYQEKINAIHHEQKATIAPTLCIWANYHIRCAYILGEEINFVLFDEILNKYSKNKSTEFIVPIIYREKSTIICLMAILSDDFPDLTPVIEMGQGFEHLNPFWIIRSVFNKPFFQHVFERNQLPSFLFELIENSFSKVSISYSTYFV